MPRAMQWVELDAFTKGGRLAPSPKAGTDEQFGAKADRLQPLLPPQPSE